MADKTKTAEDIVAAKKKKLPPIVYRSDTPENKHLSKEQFIEKRKAENVKAAKLAQFAAGLDEEEKKEKAETPAKKEKK